MNPKPANDIIPVCSHEARKHYRRTFSNGSEAIGLACTRCGNWTSVKKSSVNDPDSLPVYEDTIRDAFDEEVRRSLTERKLDREAERAEQREGWFAQYDAYLKTDKWRRKRSARLSLDRHTCTAQVRCDGSPATEVHHVTYAHLGDEPLFDLRSVCHECHEAITEMDRRKSA